MRAKVNVDPSGKTTSPRQEETWYLKMQGNCTEVFRKLNYSKIPSEVKRGITGGFSKESRMRLLRLVNRVDPAKIGKSSFITLTYPDSKLCISNNARSYHRAQFLKKLEYFDGKQHSCIWRVEWKARKSGECVGMFAPHFHFVCFNVPYVWKETLRKWWRDILDVEGDLIIDVEKLYTWSKLSNYIGKYCAKECSLDIAAYRNNPWMRGRHWGHTRKHLLPLADLDACEAMTLEQSNLARQYAAEQFTHYDPDKGGGFTLFGEEHRKAFLAMRGRNA